MRKALSSNADATIKYIETINDPAAGEMPQPPQMENLQNCLNELHTTIQMHAQRV